jgi:hypothetical protein
MAGSAILVGALGAAFQPDTAVGIVALVGGLLSGGFLFARTLWVSSGKKFHRRLTALMDSLSGTITRAALPPQARSGEAHPQRDG